MSLRKFKKADLSAQREWNRIISIWIMWLELGTQRISSTCWWRSTTYVAQQTLKLDESGLKLKHKMVAKRNRTRRFASWKHEVESSTIED